MSKPIFELALVGRVIWDLHSLNNEGTVGNVTEPRTVVLADGTKSDGVSGEMLKHLHALNFWLLTEDKEQLCEPCRTFRPQRADINESITRAVKKAAKERKATTVLETALGECDLCDVHGFLRTKEAVPRASTVEFGWAVGLRGQTYRDVHIHARHEVEGRAGAEEGVEAAQMVYHRPTRSGVYALVSVFSPWRVGLNEVTYKYVVEDEIRKRRAGRVLEAYKAMLARTDGAMTSTRTPHVEGMEGAVVVSSRNFPVPLVSPLRENYLDELSQLSSLMDGIEVLQFNSLSELFRLLDELKERELYRLKVS